MIDEKYLKKILEGSKRATIRLSKPKLSPGDEAYLHSGGKIRGIIRILSIKKKLFEELDEEDAKREGFSSLEELRKELQEIYGDLRGKRLWIIEFELLEAIEREESYGDPKKIAEEALERLELKPEEAMILRLVKETGSIRKAAKILYGDPLARRKIRRVLRCMKEKLERRENLGDLQGGNMNGK